MKKKGFVIVGMLIFVLGLMATPLLAATATQDVTFNAAATSKAKLTLSSSTINFPAADPDEISSIPASENAVSVTVKARTGSSSDVTLTVLAANDLVSVSNIIAISNVTWTATGTGFVAGTMDKTTGQSTGAWTGPGEYGGTISYFLANSWDYASATYAADATYTLTSP